ncbi:MAG: SMC family ATPase [Acidobacteria bacterium]|nr:SMC family ATPase [Acidobacteriota bacterium]
MKPKRIELEGFTAYRKHTVIEFEDADFFAIVGATGSGKSSIIDAMIFALYGSVPRFDDQKLVQPVISQGKIEARVCCHFALDGSNYSVTRIVRRSASDRGKASTKEARLEANGDVIASGAPEVTQAIIDRIGLTFDQFTRCVVLPQGAFARFLHDRPKARQDLLNQLLGLGLYERLAARAREEAGIARARAETFQTQVEALAPYTVAREQKAEACSKAVAALADRFRIERASIEDMAQQAADLKQAADNDHADRTVLADVAVPPDVAASANRRKALLAEQRSASAELECARGALDTAKRRRDDLGELAPLVKWRELLKQLAEKRSREVPERLRFEQATEAVARNDAARAALIEKREKLGDIEGLLRLQGLLRQLAASRKEAEQAAAQQAAAEQDLTEARVAREKADEKMQALGDVDSLSGLRELLVQLQAKRDRLTGSVAHLGEARARAEEARHELKEAEQAEEETREVLERLKADHHAHELRLGLRPGEPCPVCEQEVTSPPAAQPPRGLQDTEGKLTSATQRRADAADTYAGAAADATAAEQMHASLVGEIDDIQRQTATSELSSPAAVDARIGAAKSARIEAGQAGNLYASAQSFLTATEKRQQDLQRGKTELEQQLAEGWTGQPPSEPEIDEWIRSIRKADAELAEASAVHAREREELAGVETRHAALTKDIETLEERTKGSPAPAEVDAEIEMIQNIEAELGRIREEQDRAADRLDQCARTADELAEEEEVLWQQLDALRVRVIRHAPPDPDRQVGVRSSWDAMTVWAGEKAAELQERIDRARGEAAAVATQRQERLTAFLTGLAQLDVEIDTDRIPVREADIGDVLAASEEKARTEFATIRSKRQERETLETQFDDARSREVVAGRLGKLLGAASFQRWRLAGAFEQLVGSASRWLRELSSTAYSLTHTSQLGFEVIDHANADERRPVRTLSGGETFLASLSLALALADQVADLAETGAARLESMFLDEGFGSLDPEALDDVATALEELGSTGRTLGIITHVPTLAARVPVQFRVTKDASTARVERVAS